MEASKYFYLFFTVLVFGCAEKNKQQVDKELIATGNDTVLAKRTSISKKAVATYVIPMGDPKLDRKFGVEIYETLQTFKYFLVMYHDGTIQNDTLTIPNFGKMPLVKIMPGKERLSCIIGFLDSKNNFREYKKLDAKGDKLRLTTLQQYGITTYYR